MVNCVKDQICLHYNSESITDYRLEADPEKWKERLLKWRALRARNFRLINYSLGHFVSIHVLLQLSVFYQHLSIMKRIWSKLHCIWLSCSEYLSIKTKKLVIMDTLAAQPRGGLDQPLFYPIVHSLSPDNAMESKDKERAWRCTP